MTTTPTVTRITTYPIKSFDGRSITSARLTAGGGLAGDREYALFDRDGEYVNGKREPRIHRLAAVYDGPESAIDRVRVDPPDVGSVEFELPEEVDAFGEWASDWFGYPVSVDRDPSGGFPDDTEAAGPTVISTATIETVASWFEGIDTEGMRRRLRANVEIDGVPAFWEDRLFEDRSHGISFSIGDVTLHGYNPCQRCAVPSRDPDTGEPYVGFPETFRRKRQETLPGWSGGEWFDHYFRLMVNTKLPAESIDRTIAVGDPIRIEGRVPIG